ncbi:hypothetical protein OAS39_07940 [Pirellulales bacterium]|nr:hypothetical protein [Pirellulales bacterium]
MATQLGTHNTKLQQNPDTSIEYRTQDSNGTTPPETDGNKERRQAADLKVGDKVFNISAVIESGEVIAVDSGGSQTTIELKDTALRHRYKSKNAKGELETLEGEVLFSDENTVTVTLGAKERLLVVEAPKKTLAELTDDELEQEMTRRRAAANGTS